jgi:RNA polymerase sigma-70 factor (ECF subfamily)
MEKNFTASDKELIKDCLKGDEKAFKKIFEKYWGDLYIIAYRRLPFEEEIKDILQEVFISLWRNIHKISVDDNLGGYLYTSLRNKIFNYYEKNKVRMKITLSQSFNPVQSEADVYSSINSKEIREIIRLAVAEMPAKMQQIYLLSKEEQLTNQEIAALLALAPQTIKNQIHQALSRVRQKIREANFHLWLPWF